MIVISLNFELNLLHQIMRFTFSVATIAAVAFAQNDEETSLDDLISSCGNWLDEFGGAKVSSGEWTREIVGEEKIYKKDGVLITDEDWRAFEGHAENGCKELEEFGDADDGEENAAASNSEKDEKDEIAPTTDTTSDGAAYLAMGATIGAAISALAF